MTTTLRFFAVLALGTWIGGSFFLMFLAAPVTLARTLVVVNTQSGLVAGSGTRKT